MGKVSTLNVMNLVSSFLRENRRSPRWKRISQKLLRAAEGKFHRGYYLPFHRGRSGELIFNRLGISDFIVALA